MKTLNNIKTNDQANKKFEFKGIINQELINKLEEKYPTTQEQKESLNFFGRYDEYIGEKLLTLAKEYLEK